jgi:poly(hydroxyalkanoate) depolymerase family esterase
MITVLLTMTMMAGSPGAVPPPAALPAVAPADTGRWLRAFHGTPEAGLSYRLYVPPTGAGAAPGAGTPRAMFVVLHGCTQTADAVAEATRFNEHAARRGFLVLYPEQAPAAHPLRCWNWYDAAHQRRDAGEPSLIADLTRAVAAEHGVDSGQVHLVGISAGALMAGILAASYRELYAGLGLHSGSMYAPARTLETAMAVMRGELPDYADLAGAALRAMGAAAKPLPVIVVHGSADAVVHPSNARAAARQWALTAALAAGLEVEPAPETFAGAAGGYPFERLRWTVGGTRIELLLVEGLGHAWSGGLPGGSYSDPSGPDATAAMIEFLLGAG